MKNEAIDSHDGMNPSETMTNACRRKGWSSLLALFVFAATIWGGGCAASSEPDRPPNVIFVLADDLGWAELGSYGNTFNETPHLDALAREGVRFTQSYATPYCSPSRVSIMTGQYPARVGITDFLRPDDSLHLPLQQITLAEAFQEAGYATGIVGKWHLTGYEARGVEETPPSVHGFNETMVSESDGIASGSYYYPYHFNPDIDRRLPEPEYLVDRTNHEAVEFIERHRNEPFFLYLSHYAVHAQLVGKPEIVDRFRAKPVAGSSPATPQRGWPEDHKAPENNPHLAAQLWSIDEGVGMIVDKLEELGLSENTIVVFMGDNGGDLRYTSNRPLRGGKRHMYEGGIRVPLIYWAPGRVAEGEVAEMPVSSIDLYPTLLEMSGVDAGSRQHLDGASYARLVRGEDQELDRPLYWHQLRQSYRVDSLSASAVRLGDWKLIEFYGSGDVELYNLAEDRGEHHNLADQFPSRAASLQNRLEIWRRDIGADVPSRAAGE